MPAKRPPGPPRGFDVPAFLRHADVARRAIKFAPDAQVFAQGAQATSVFYIESGSVKLSVLSSTGKEAVVGDPRCRATSSAKGAWPASRCA